MSADNKYHIRLNDVGYIVARKRDGSLDYSKQEAPFAVNKFGSGDPAYRDLTFWQYWAQINWRNGMQQDFFDDGGKYWRSQNVDVTTPGQIKLARALESAGQAAAGLTIKKFFGWRVSQSWWDNNYTYSRQITVTAPSGQTLPTGYPVELTLDSAALETAGKVQADRDDWRVVYWNGVSYTDLTRDYVGTVSTFFAIQNSIAAGGSDSNYYVYYGYAGETTSKEPSTAADWNSIYTPPDETDVKLLIHVKETSGTTLGDTSGESHDITLVGSPTYVTGRHGKAVSLSGSSQYGTLADHADLKPTGNYTLEAWIKTTASDGTIFQSKRNDGLPQGLAMAVQGTKLVHHHGKSSEWSNDVISDTAVNDGNWHHVAATWDGSYIRLYIDGVVDKTVAYAVAPTYNATNYVRFGCENNTGTNFDFFNGQIDGLRLTNGTAKSSFSYVLSSEPSSSTGSEVQALSSSSYYDIYLGADDGKIYKHDGNTTWTEQFDCRRLEWFESGTDGSLRVGDTSGVEKQQAQGFQLDAASTIKEVELYLKATDTDPAGALTVRIETDNAGVPSGTLAHANATTTIANFTETSYAWKLATFTKSFALSASTTYWIVVSCTAQASDVGWEWAADTSSPGYTAGTAATKNGAWAAVAGTDLYFRVKSDVTQINDVVISSIGGTQYAWVATGDVDSQNAGDARLYTFDGTTWVLRKVFTGTGDVQVLSLADYNSTIWAGVGLVGRIYKTTDASAWSEAEDIDVPDKPGYPYVMHEYNRKLYIGGGSPEYLPSGNYNGFFYITDGATFRSVFPFQHTVVKSMQFYDSFLFIGTYHGDLYLYDLASLDVLFDFGNLFEDTVTIEDMAVYEDQLILALKRQTNEAGGNEGVAVFDRHGLSLRWKKSGIRGYTAVEQIGNSLYIGTENDGNTYKVSKTLYETTGNLQTSYFDANLPSIEKLWQSVYVQFEKLPEGCTIELQYKEDEDDSSFTSIGSFSTTNATEAVFLFPAGTYSKKVSLKVVLTTTNTTVTPVIKKLVTRYLPYPDLRFIWRVKVVAATGIELLDHSMETKPALLLKENIWGTRRTRQLFDFKDLDYAQTAINDTDGITASDTTITVDSTEGFPAKGRIRIEDEEIYYTGKTSTTFTGCTRGVKDTKAATHANDMTVSNVYKVLFHETGEPLLVGSTNEAEISLTLLEA